MDAATLESVTVHYHAHYADMDEAEQEMARRLGAGEVQRSPLVAFGTKAFIGLFGSLFETVTTVSGDGVHVKDAKFGMLPWREIGDSYETEHLVVLVIARTTAPITLPKRAMSQAELDTIRAHIAARVTTDEPGHVATNWALRGR